MLCEVLVYLNIETFLYLFLRVRESSCNAGVVYDSLY